MNNRNHRKIVVIDGHIGYVGGFNVGDEYLGLKKNLDTGEIHISVSLVMPLTLYNFVLCLTGTHTQHVII